MTHVSAIFSLDALYHEILVGNVRFQTGPSGYRIFNYSEKAAYEGNWNNVTSNCRGLILDQEHNVVARPWAKFHNHGDPHAAFIDPDLPVEVTDKIDGSLGILYLNFGMPAIATRGSFQSEQAEHGSNVLYLKYINNIDVEGETLESLLVDVPDEWHDYLTKEVNSLFAEYKILESVVHDYYYDIHDFEDRREFAKRALLTPYSKFLFLLKDGKSIEKLIWQSIKPPADKD